MANYQQNLVPLEPGKYYHVFNRANGNDMLFRSKADYFYFLQKMKRFLEPIAHIYAYCLIPNHFHLLVQILSVEQLPEKVNTAGKLPGALSKHFSNWFNSYTKSFNKAWQRHGGLFEEPFKRSEISRDNYLLQVIYYIHRNPIHHGLCLSLDEWPYSSYQDVSNGQSEYIDLDFYRLFFKDASHFRDAHQQHILDRTEKYSWVIE